MFMSKSTDSSRNNQKLLSIVIPTYNRSKYIEGKLEWIERISDHLGEIVEYYIIDNASTDNTKEVCDMRLKTLSKQLKYIRNDYNIGLVRNCLKGIDKSEAKYVWLIGDDDPIDENCIDKVVAILQSHPDLDILHLNHRCINGLDNSIIHESFYQAENFISNSNNTSKLEKLILKSGTGGFMFITANIINRQKANEFISKTPLSNNFGVAYPLLLNLSVAGKGKCYFFSEVVLSSIYHTGSWLNEYDSVIYDYIPNIIFQLKNHGFSKAFIKNLLAHQPKVQLNKRLLFKSLVRLNFSYLFSYLRRNLNYFSLRCKLVSL